LTYKQDANTRQLVSIKRQILKASGTVTGDVVKVYNDFWVEVKPKKGLADAYAPGANYNDKEFMAPLKGLKEGDSVTITFTTDFERHRITASDQSLKQIENRWLNPSESG
jgi:anaerobic selenocysteine-containing dehydrogenase